jgi:ribonucleoside-diphosphate reductase alpha chain
MTVQEWLGEENKLGIDIWEKKYRNEEETFEEWLERVSGGNRDVKELISQKKFLFGGRILANRGVPGNRTYSNCYVLTPPEDNLESIFECAKKLARTFSYGGGCGVDLGKLCPKDAKVNNTAKKSSGAVSFMDLYNTTTGLIGQNGRRGALMLSMPVHHPDIEEFIGVKSDLSKVTNANISVRVTDDFMRAVEADEDFELRFVRPESGEEIVKTVRAKELFHKMCEMNWNYAEPGILFWDRIQDRTMLQFDPNFEFAGTNPCAEEPLPAGGSCLLGSINLAEFVRDPFTLSARFDYNGFCDAVKVAVSALNDVLDEGLELHPLQEQRESVGKWRQIGLGIMGLADMLIKLGIQYGSDDAVDLCDDIACTMFKNAVVASQHLADTHGSYEEFNPNYINESDMIQEAFPKCFFHKMRNSQLLTIAPTGSLSTMIGVSGGIEPIFANHYERRTISLHGEEVVYKVYTPIVKQYMESHGLDDDNELPKEFVVAGDIPCEKRVSMQAAFQNWIDASISSTVNLPHEATVEDVENIYLSAWKNGLKGITIYRAGCAREGILVEDGTKPEEKSEYKRGDIVPVSDNLIGLKRKLITGCGSLHCMAYFDADTKELRETYLSKGSTGGCNNFMTGLSRMISLSARAGVSLDNIIDQLNSCGVCPSYASRKATHGDVSPGSCCPIAVARALREMHDSITDGVTIAPSVANGAKCPSCGEELTHEGGCNICKNCGWTKCD